MRPDGILLIRAARRKQNYIYIYFSKYFMCKCTFQEVSLSKRPTIGLRENENNLRGCVKRIPTWNEFLREFMKTDFFLRDFVNWPIFNKFFFGIAWNALFSSQCVNAWKWGKICFIAWWRDWVPPWGASSNYTDFEKYFRSNIRGKNKVAAPPPRFRVWRATRRNFFFYVSIDK